MNIKRRMSRRNFCLGLIILGVALALFWTVQTKNNSEQTTVEHIKMVHKIEQLKKGVIYLEMEVQDLKYDGKDNSYLEDKDKEKIEVAYDSDEKHLIKEVRVRRGVIPDYQVENSEFEKRSIIEQIPQMLLHIKRKIQGAEKIESQPYIGEQKQFELIGKYNKEPYEGPIEIRMNNSKFSKVFIGEVENGLLKIEEEKIIIHNSEE